MAAELLPSRVEAREAPPPSRPRDVEPAHRGTGLLIAGGVLGAVGLAANIAAIALVANPNMCDDLEQTDPVRQAQTVLDCTAEVGPLVAVRSLAMASNVVATGLIWGGADLRGRHDAWLDASRGRVRRTGPAIGIGIGLATVGVVWGIVAFPVYGLLEFAECSTADCLRSRAIPYYATRELAAMASMTGFGLAGWGIQYRRSTKDRGLRAHELRLFPRADGRSLGVGLAGRF